jgi:iron complex transport system permease protein
MPSRALTMTALVAAACAAIVLGLSSGSVDVGLRELWQLATGELQGMAQRVVVEVRLPRVVAGFAVGGLLALSGTLMQLLLRNPLADPYILGVSGGASVFALLAISLGLGGFFVHAAAFAGALCSMLLVFALSRSGGAFDPARMILTGVVVAAGWGAVISFLLAVSPAAQLHGMLFWLMGDLGKAGLSKTALAVLAAGFVIAWALSRHLNVLLHGEQHAAALGVAVGRMRWLLYFLGSLLAAAAVMQAGSIGFIGLVVPHVARLLLGSDHRILIPASVLLGGALLVAADTLARTIVAPQQLPVGVLCALLGVPLFLYLLARAARRSAS